MSELELEGHLEGRGRIPGNGPTISNGTYSSVGNLGRRKLWQSVVQGRRECCCLPQSLLQAVSLSLSGAHECCLLPPSLQGSAKRWSPGLVNYVAALAYHSYLALRAAFTQPGPIF